jgi:ABC-type branched-subunit amino acid transport system substrate-binding protein
VTDFDRRKFLLTTGGAFGAALAGCSSNNDGGDGGSDGSDGSDGGGDGGDGGDGGSGDEGTGSDGSSGGVEQREINIGTLLPASGRFSGIGSTMVDAAELAFNVVDDGSEYFDVNATFADTQSETSDALSAANNLANAGVPGVVGAAITVHHQAVAEQVFVPNEITACSPSATGVVISDVSDPDDLLFRSAPSDALQGRAMARYADSGLEAETAATLFVNDDLGSGLSETFTSEFESKGGTVQETVSYETDASSYTSRIQSAMSGDPDLLVVIGYVESCIKLFRDYYARFSADQDILTVDGLNTARVPNEVGQDMDNVVGTAPLSGGPGFDTFTSMYRDTFDRAPGPYNTNTFDAAACLMLANAAAGENDAMAISDQMRAVANDGEMTVTPENLAEGVDAAAEGANVNYQGASSRLAFGEDGDLQTSRFRVWEYDSETESGISTVEEYTLE